jgi:nitrogenase molybdenum-iron protein alpha chain
MANLTEGLTYTYLGASAAPTREERIGVCYAFCGSCKALKENMGSGCAKNASRKFAQAGGCQLMLALGILSSFSNVVIVIHSPLGCASTFVGSGGMRRQQRASRGIAEEEFIYIHTNLDEMDVISGGIDKLKNAILYAEKEYRPDAIIIANGCVPGIIGDDIDTLIDDLDKKLSAKVVPIHCEGFKSKFVASGYDSAYHGVLKKLVDPIPRYERAIPDEGKDAFERYQISRTVNIFNVGSNSRGDEAELSRLVQALGLIPKVVPLNSSVEDLSKIGDVALNVSICATHDDYLLGHLKERFGTEYVLNALPIGIQSTNQWIWDIAEYFHLEKEAEKLIKFETEQLNEALESFKEILNGKTLYVGGGETRIFTTGVFFRDLGMDVIGLKPHNFDRFAFPYLEEFENEDTVVHVAPGQPSEELNLLNRYRPDLYIGHIGANAWVTKLGIPNMPLFGMAFNYMGYSGAYELARKAVKILKNTSFVHKISQNVALPFRADWFETDPYSNINDMETV